MKRYFTSHNGPFVSYSSAEELLYCIVVDGGMIYCHYENDKLQDISRSFNLSEIERLVSGNQWREVDEEDFKKMFKSDYLKKWAHLEEDGWEILEENVPPIKGDQYRSHSSNRWKDSSNYKFDNRQGEDCKPYRRRIVNKTKWVFIGNTIVKHIHTSHSGKVAIEFKDGSIGACNITNIKDAPPECDDFDWKPVKEVKIGCKTLSVKDGYVYINGTKEYSVASMKSAIDGIKSLLPGDCKLTTFGVSGYLVGLDVLEDLLK